MRSFTIFKEKNAFPLYMPLVFIVELLFRNFFSKLLTNVPTLTVYQIYSTFFNVWPFEVYRSTRSSSFSITKKLSSSSLCCNLHTIILCNISFLPLICSLRLRVRIFERKKKPVDQDDLQIIERFFLSV